MLIQVVSYAQTGSLKGIASDSIHSETLIGAVVSMEGNNSIGAVTDVDGVFLIENIPAGTYNFKISYLGYADHILTNVKIAAGSTTDIGNVNLKSESDDRMEVTVVGSKVTNSQEAVIQEIKQSEQVVSGISSEQISKSQDRDAAQVVSRIPGVTIIADQFIIVRGLNQRYNAIMLNGLNAPSTEVDSRAFALNIIPSAMLDRVMVYKSGAPELMADMTGSLVKLYTRSAVQENFANANFSLSYRPGTTGTQQQSQTMYSSDLFGNGNKNRAFPSSFPANFNSPDMIYNRPGQESATKSLQTDWSLNQKTINPDVRIGFNIGRLYTSHQKRLSTILSVNYSNTWMAINAQRARNVYSYDSSSSSYIPSQVFNYQDKTLVNNVRAGVIWNTAFVINPKHKIEFKNMYNQFGLATSTYRTGVDYSGSTTNDVISRALYYQQRGVYSGQLIGSHDLNKEKTHVNWVLGYSNITRKEPNRRIARETRETGTTIPFEVDVPNQPTDNSGALFSSNLKEDVLAGTVNVEHQLTKATDTNEGIKIRGGFYLEERKRNFSSRWMSYARATSAFNTAILGDPLETIFSDPNIDAITGIIIKEGTDGSNAYKGESQLMAAYAGATIPVRKFNFSFGVRFEQNKQTLISTTQSGVPVNVNNTKTNILPSLNVTYNINKKHLVRAAFAQTINRPELRELAPFGFYDYENNWKITGNPNLKNTLVNNYDLRWEFYPSDNESISFGGFYKDLTNPIEMSIEPVGTADPAFVYTNAPSAKCYGLELEIRKSLNFISDKEVFNRFSVILNGSLIRSEVNVDPTTLTPGQATTRPLQGQSPYIINAGLYYTDDAKQFQVNIMYNLVGPKTAGVGNRMFATLYEVQRNLIDLNIIKGLGKHWELKAGIRDILNAPFIVKEDSDRDNKNSAADQQVTYFRMGSYYTMGVNYKF